MKRKLFNFISENPIIAKLQYGMKVNAEESHISLTLIARQITFIFILILFIDSVNRVYSVQVELAKTKSSNKYGYSTLAGLTFTDNPTAPPCSKALAEWKFKPANSIPNATCTSADSPSSSP